MSTKDVKSALLNFLENDEPGVLCLTGKWGVGKTYLWNNCLKESKDKIKLATYSYVSLFGISSLDELKIKTCLEVSPIKESTKRADPQAIKDRLLKLKKGAQLLAPILDKFTDTNKIISTLGFRAFSKSLVCIDDIERKSINLTMQEVLSFASFLREYKQCKVIILMNSDALEEKDQETLKKQQEKVVDTSIILNTSCDEAVDIAFQSKTDEDSSLLKECIKKLGIKNIRIIKKIQESAEKILKHLPLPSFDLSVRKQALQTLCLYSWVHYDSGQNVPTMDFLRRYNQYSSFKETDEKEQIWQTTLTNYDYTQADEFDLEIYQFIVHGYVLEIPFLQQANLLNERVAFAAVRAEFTAAWNLFHDTFENNQDELLDTIYNSFKKAVKTIDPRNLDGTANIFCDLNDKARAKELIDFYIEERKNETNLFDLDKYAFGSDINNPLVLDAFRMKSNGKNSALNLKETIEKISKEGIGRKTDLKPMIDANEDDYYRYFSSLQGRDHIRECIQVCLIFRGRDDDSRTIGEKTVAALKKISDQSLVNKRRISRFIKLDDIDAT